jgi:hypothetical protein
MRKYLEIMTSVLIASAFLTGCSANNASVKTNISPVDGKIRTVIQGSDFSTSWIYPVEGSSMLGMLIVGGSVIEKETASIIFSVTSNSGFRSAFFKADGEVIDLRPTKATTDFSSGQLGVEASKEFLIGCEPLNIVVQSTDVYLRITYADGFVDYDVSKPKYSGADGFGMIKKIASYCN